MKISTVTLENVAVKLAQAVSLLANARLQQEHEDTTPKHAKLFYQSLLLHEAIGEFLDDLRQNPEETAR